MTATPFPGARAGVCELLSLERLEPGHLNDPVADSLLERCHDMGTHDVVAANLGLDRVDDAPATVDVLIAEAVRE